MTVGLSEGARLATKDCRACGHKMSLHGQVRSSASTVVLVGSGMEEEAPLVAKPTARDLTEIKSRLEKARQEAQALDEKADGLAAKGKKFGETNARSAAKRARKQEAFWAERFETVDAELRAKAQEAVAEALAVPPEPSTGTADLSEQLARLVDLHAGGGLTDEEFSSAKARLLG